MPRVKSVQTMRVLDLSVKSGDCIKLKVKIHQGAKRSVWLIGFRQICLCYQADDIKVKVDGQEISFPNRLGLNTAQYFSVDGDMSLLSFKC
ncbi:hypothetical protein Chor_011535 [Crotalus horridus]